MKQLVAVGLMCVIACGGSSKPAQQPTVANTPAPTPEPAPAPAPAAPDASSVSDAEFDAMMNKAMGMFEAMGAAADAAAGDCHKLSVGFNQVIDDNQAFLDDAKRWKNDPTMDARAEAWMKDKLDGMMPLMMKIGTAGQQCGGDAEFQAVMTRMDALK